MVIALDLGHVHASGDAVSAIVRAVSLQLVVAFAELARSEPADEPAGHVLDTKFDVTTTRKLEESTLRE